MNHRPVQLTRRRLLAAIGSMGAATTIGALPALVQAQSGSSGRVVVVGGGFGGATAARYLKIYNPSLSVTLIEPVARFVTCPFSNMVLGGLRTIDEISHGYDGLRAMGIDVVTDLATDIDASAKTLSLSGGRKLPWDKLVLSPGIDFRWGAIAGYDEAAAQIAPHAWKAGPQTLLLKRQLEEMPDGGLFIMSVPANPYRCPPGPYERVGMIAHYLKTHKPKSKMLVLDAKESFSKQTLFLDGWRKFYDGMIEWVPSNKDGTVVRVDAANREVETEFGQRHKAAVLNVIPPQKAGLIAERAGTVDKTGWVPVKPANFESSLVPGVYVVGDATLAAPMPKSAFCANAQAKVVAADIAAALAGQPAPVASWANTCYSLIAPDYGISISAVYDVQDGKLAEIKGSTGISPRDADAAFRKREAEYGASWYRAISMDTWGQPG